MIGTNNLFFIHHLKINNKNNNSLFHLALINTVKNFLNQEQNQMYFNAYRNPISIRLKKNRIAKSITIFNRKIINLLMQV